MRPWLLLIIGLALAGDATAEKRYYEIRIEKQLAGYVVYEMLPVRKGVTEIRALTRLRLVTSGGQQLIQLSETTRLRGGRPFFHTLERIRAKTTEKVEVLFEQGRARVSILGKGIKIERTIKIADAVKRGCGLFATYRHLVGITQPTRLQVFDPETNSIETMQVTPGPQKAVTLAGKRLRIGVFQIVWGERREKVMLDLESGWPFRVDRTAPVAATIGLTDDEVALRVKGLVLDAAKLYRRPLAEPANQPIPYKVYHRRVKVAEGSYLLQSAEAPAAYRLIDKTNWGTDKNALKIRLSGTLRADLSPIRMRKSRTGGTKRALAINCQFERKQVRQVSSGEHAALSGVVPTQGTVFPLDLECVGLYAVLASQFPHEPGAVVYYRAYGWKKLQRYFIRVKRLPSKPGDKDLLRFQLDEPGGKIELATDKKGRFRWLARKTLLIVRTK